MPRATAASQLTSLVKRLKAERGAHVSAIAAIDADCAQLGISLGPVKRGPGRPKGSGTAAKKAPAAKPKRAGRGSYKQSAEEYILSLLAGGKKLTTSQVVGQWRQTKRGGKADNALSKLSKANVIKRQNIKGSRGSVYSLA
jgi:hypothetical protein